MPTLFHRHFSLRSLAYILLVCTLIIFFLSYLAFQARRTILGPLVTLTQEPSLIASTTTTLSGIAQNIVFLSLNGRTIYTDDAGNFRETLALPVGYTVVTLTAKDRYGRSRSLERTYVRAENTR